MSTSDFWAKLLIPTLISSSVDQGKHLSYIWARSSGWRLDGRASRNLRQYGRIKPNIDKKARSRHDKRCLRRKWRGQSKVDHAAFNDWQRDLPVDRGLTLAELPEGLRSV
jgi:hypothetical protein